MMERTLEEMAIPIDRAGVRRQRIIAAARILFLRNGFHATGVAQIARESGIAVGQIYRDFACKEEIVSVIVQGDCAEFLEYDSLRRGIETGDKDLVWAWLADFLDPAKSESDILLAEIVAESARNARIAAIFESTRDSVADALLRALEVLAPGAHLAERRATLVNLVMALALGFLQHRVTRPKQVMAATCKLALEMVRSELVAMRGISPHSGPPA